MKLKSGTVVFFSLSLLLLACAAHRNPGYELPDAMLPHVKDEYSKRCEKGKILYGIACAGCHNVKKGRKEIIPDFSPEQLIGYSLRVSNKEHQRGMTDSLVTEEELGIIMTFLSYKNKSKVVFAPNK